MTAKGRSQQTKAAGEQAQAFVFTAEPKPKKASKLRRDERGERVAVYLPPADAEALRVLCAKQRRSVSDAVTEAVAAWLRGQGA